MTEKKTYAITGEEKEVLAQMYMMLNTVEVKGKNNLAIIHNSIQALEEILKRLGEEEVKSKSVLPEKRVKIEDVPD